MKNKRKIWKNTAKKKKRKHMNYAISFIARISARIVAVLLTLLSAFMQSVTTTATVLACAQTYFARSRSNQKIRIFGERNHTSAPRSQDIYQSAIKMNFETVCQRDCASVCLYLCCLFSCYDFKWRQFHLFVSNQFISILVKSTKKSAKTNQAKIAKAQKYVIYEMIV